MNVKRLLILIVFSFYFGADMIAQEIKWAVHANAGISQIVFLDLDVRSNFFKKIKLRNHFNYTWNYGSSLAISVGEGVDLETGLSVLGINGKMDRKEPFPSNSDRFYKIINTTETYYLGIPVKLNFPFDKFVFSSGFKTLIFIKGEFVNSSPNSIDEAGNQVFFEERDTLKFQRFDLGLSLGFKYKINESFSMNIDGYWGLSNMFADSSYTRDGFSRKNRYLTLGMSYYLKPI